MVEDNFDLEEYYAKRNRGYWLAAARKISEYLWEIRKPKSAIDLGCATGQYLAGLANKGTERVVGVDIAPEAKKHAATDNFILRDLTKPLELDERFELVICLEVAEHLPEESADVLINNITKVCAGNGIVVFSAAQPGQQSSTPPHSRLEHKNEQLPAYWIEKFRDRGFSYLPDITKHLSYKIGNSGVSNLLSWVRDNVMVFAPAISNIQDYVNYYRGIMKQRIELEGAKSAVGAKWEVMKKLQFDLLKEYGLKPHHTLLDIGCGCLRGGIKFIEYLDKGNYCGMDISKPILDKGIELLQERKLENKEPILIYNVNLQFREFSDKVFDYILAQSLFTHTSPEQIEECFTNINKIMDGNSIFLATYFDTKMLKEAGAIEESKENTWYFLNGKDWFYSAERLIKSAKQYGLKAKLIEDFEHPNGQNLLKIILIR